MEQRHARQFTGCTVLSALENWIALNRDIPRFLGLRSNEGTAGKFVSPRMKTAHPHLVTTSLRQTLQSLSPASYKYFLSTDTRFPSLMLGPQRLLDCRLAARLGCLLDALFECRLDPCRLGSCQWGYCVSSSGVCPASDSSGIPGNSTEYASLRRLVPRIPWCPAELV